jgi:hypothetical protein
MSRKKKKELKKKMVNGKKIFKEKLHYLKKRMNFNV